MLRAGRSSPPPRSYAGRNPNPCKLLQGRVPGTRVASETEAVGIGSSAAFTGHRCAWRITRVCPENLGCSQQPRESLLLFQQPCESRSQHGWLRNPPFTLRSTHPEPTFCSQTKLPSRQLQPHTSPDPPRHITRSHRDPPALHRARQTPATHPTPLPTTPQGTAATCPPLPRASLEQEELGGARGGRGHGRDHAPYPVTSFGCLGPARRQQQTLLLPEPGAVGGAEPRGIALFPIPAKPPQSCLHAAKR